MNRIKELRELKGLKQKEFAQYLGVSKRTFQNWEYGDSPIPSDCLEKMSERFNVSVDYLLGLNDYHHEEDPDIQVLTGLSQESIDVLRRHAKDGSDEHLEGFIEAINFFLEEMDAELKNGKREDEIPHLLDEIYHFICGNHGVYFREERLQYQEKEDEVHAFYRLRSIETSLINRRNAYYKERKENQ